MEAISKMDISKLIKLGDIDYKLNKLEAFKGDLPEIVQRLENELATSTDEYLKSKNELEEAQKTTIINKNETELLYDKLIKFQEQSYSVKTNKEYDAITIEIETSEKKIEDNEKMKSDLLHQVEEVTNEVSKLEKQVADLKSELAVKQAELKEKMSKTEAEELKLKKEREDIANQIDKKILYNYNRIRNGTNGIALAEVDNYTCSECYATIPAQKVVEVRMMDRIILCEVCGRILIPSQKQKEQHVLAV